MILWTIEICNYCKSHKTFSFLSSTKLVKQKFHKFSQNSLRLYVEIAFYLLLYPIVNFPSPYSKYNIRFNCNIFHIKFDLRNRNPIKPQKGNSEISLIYSMRAHQIGSRQEVGAEGGGGMKCMGNMCTHVCGVCVCVCVCGVCRTMLDICKCIWLEDRKTNSSSHELVRAQFAEKTFT